MNSTINSTDYSTLNRSNNAFCDARIPPVYMWSQHLRERRERMIAHEKQDSLSAEELAEIRTRYNRLLRQEMIAYEDSVAKIRVGMEKNAKLEKERQDAYDAEKKRQNNLRQRQDDEEMYIFKVTVARNKEKMAEAERVKKAEATKSVELANAKRVAKLEHRR